LNLQAKHDTLHQDECGMHKLQGQSSAQEVKTIDQRNASLSDKFDLSEPRQLLSGTQAIVRLALMQKARDRAAGLNTAGYVTGYRGSPIATLEAAFNRARKACADSDIVFEPAINEDLAATALWGAQQAELRGEGRFDGVFGIWYGKGPGVDRSGDAFRHANHAGTSRHGGVLALMGDDHTCESSTSAHQSEFAFVDAMMPVLNPAGVQEILDLGLLGIALSRYAGVWVGLKCVKDSIESTATVDGRVDRVQVSLPSGQAFSMPPGGLNIRLGDTALAKEARLHEWKRGAILAFARANGLDRVVLSGGAKRRIGIVTTGKSYQDTRQALEELGLDEARAGELGLALYKVAMTWPLEPRGLVNFAQGLDLILVVEEKRSLIETQVKEQLYDHAQRPRVLGKKDEAGHWLFPAHGALDPIDIAVAIGSRLAAASGDAVLTARVAELQKRQATRAATPDVFTRIPYFCAGCPHNTSTKVPEGSRAYAGIGCHYMAQWMDRATEGFTQMGAEGANWIGENRFSTRGHVFQNIGDGTYVHSGSLAIRAAVAASTNVTFKILFNDAVAMTGGQPLEGHLTVPQLARQVVAEGVTRLDIVTDEPAKYAAGAIPGGVKVHDRHDLDSVQRALAATPGVTALIYDQTCAAEKRRRRRRGTYPDPARRVFINAAVCEGCGDCGAKSNCVAILPLETDLGRKRQIDQSACNKDFSCLDGFCPSFVTLTGAVPRRADPTLHGETINLVLPEPGRPALDRPYAVLVTGIGGTGVVTVSAVLGQAAHIAGLGFGAIDVTGLAQKGGAVACHMRFASRPDGIHAIRIGTAHADLILGGDLVVAAAAKVLATVRPGHTVAVVSSHEQTTGAFTRQPNLVVPGSALTQAVTDSGAILPTAPIDVQAAALHALGDSLYANMMLLGLAYQLGLIPVGSEAIENAVRLNATSVSANLAAFRLGRLAVHDRTAFERLARAPMASRGEPQQGLDAIVARRAEELTRYQDQALARRYRDLVERMAVLERQKAPGETGLAEAVARAYHKVLAIKDEYEVARLLTDESFDRQIAAEFERVSRIDYHLAPPFLALRRDRTTGEPRKLRLGPWARPLLRLLARGKSLRGNRLDIFGWTAERRLERRMIVEFERLMVTISEHLSPGTHAAAVELTALALEVRGFGHVKRASYERTQNRRRQLFDVLCQQAPSNSRASAAAE
jgi:indolepyruvate ferredoxin oxidoreductase